MKKVLCILLACVLIFAFTACGDEKGSEAETSSNALTSTKSQDSTVDVDLTALSSTMVYSEVYNMVTTPDDYLGKKVKMSGTFGTYQDPETQKYYFACLIADATACCSQGIEFVLDGDYSYPKDYPEENANITVTGIFDTYVENGYTYCQLINAKMV